MDCHICKFENVNHKVINNELIEINCLRCGDYKYTRSAENTLQSLSSSDKIKLSTITRNSTIWKRKLYDFDTENIKEIIKSYPNLSVPEKIDKLTINLSKLINNPNDVIGINETIDYPLAYAKNRAEISYYLEYLEDENIVVFTQKSEDRNLLKITVPGWRYIGELQKKPGSSDKAFVAMNFDEEFDELYEKAIYKAIDENNFKPILAKREEHIDLIDDFIMAEIKDSNFVVAEFTGQKHGVYFEAGYARGLGIPVIWLCRKDEIGLLHFDINHYNQIDWETPEELKERLSNRIRAVI